MDAMMQLSRRERQIMHIIYARGQATAAQVHQDMPGELTRTSVRTFLRILEAKGHLRHSKHGREFIYRPVRPRTQAARSALRRLLSTFFGDSLEEAVAVRLADPRRAPSEEELKRLADLIDQARDRGR